jgi:hypothetical protein
LSGVATRPEPRDLSPEEQQERAQHCFELSEAIKAGLRAGREAMWETARACAQFDDENGWTALGYESLNHYLADPEVSVTRSTFFRWVQVYREVSQRRIPESTLGEIELSKVQIVLPAVKTGKVKMADALEDVKALGAQDLRTKYMKRPDPKDLADAAKEDPELDSTPISTPDPADPPLNPTDDTPVRASDGQPLDPGPETEDEEGQEEEVVEGEVVDEPAQNATPATSGQLPADPEGPSAAEVVEWIDLALNNGSQAMQLNALRKAKAFIVAVFPEVAS